MSRKNEYELKKHRGALVGSPVGELSIEINIADIGATEDIKIHDDFSWPAQVVSCQVVSIGLTGTLDGTVDLCQSNDAENYDLLGIQTTLSATNGSNTIEKDGFSGKYLGVRIGKVGLTGGVLKLIFIVKHK